MCLSSPNLYLLLISRRKRRQNIDFTLYFKQRTDVLHILAPTDVGASRVGKIYQQTFIDTYSKVALAKIYDRKTALVAADMLNDKVIPFFEEHTLKLLRILTDRGTEYCGAREHHEFQL